MRSLSALTIGVIAVGTASAFAPSPVAFSRTKHNGGQSQTTSLNASGVLARKAKEMDVRKYCEGGVEESVLAKVEELKSKLGAVDLMAVEGPGPLQTALTKRKGTIAVVAEYKRRLADSGFIDEVFDPEQMSPSFREFGASAVAVMADERMGGCSYDDLSEFVKEQESARGDMPGPLHVICSDLMVDEVQIARSAANDASAVLLNVGALGGMERTEPLMKAAAALGMESIVTVSTPEEAQAAVQAGARILLVSNIGDPDEKRAIVDGVPDNVCTIASISMRSDNELEEIEEAWILRDKGFNAVWVADALYKFGADANEHPGAIIKSMGAKSSVKWATPKAQSGKGEGSREYLGDIMM
jgi:indole-3-glycerol phosphate synthase